MIPNPNFDAIADAEERIHCAELALQRTEEMLAENIALRRKMRCLVDTANREINPPAIKGVARLEPGRRLIRYLSGQRRQYSRS
ncbi:hypothetical protein [Mesorhizobium sangaii]|uniref:Uncharacterized protein n=1 Tax=Mesorhizobium sangaii TaxID=505389 RepID=A0A841P805_9HYPH|nr:hypothetical protein [Mesorhizobium sangaii]MBB6411276.1 hypothetical protein [Mesorhizobium sangaii]